MNNLTDRFCVCVAQHNLLRRQSLITLLNNKGYASININPAEWLDKVRLQKPDFAFLEADTDGLELCRNIRATPQSATKCILFFEYDSRYLISGLFADASGYLYNDAHEDEIMLCLQRLRGGERYINAAMMRQFNQPQVLAYQKTITALSKREREVFRYLGYNHSTKQLAELLCMSHKTVETHFEHIKQKLKLTDMRELRLRAITEVGILHPNSENIGDLPDDNGKIFPKK